MIGVILFDNHDDLLYVYSDHEFKNRIRCVSNTLDMCAVPGEIAQDDDIRTRLDAESMILMQIFSPLLTSYRIMNQEFQNSYDCITCEDGSTTAFYEQMGFLLIAVAKSTVNAAHLARVSFSVMQHVCGPSLSVYNESLHRIEAVAKHCYLSIQVETLKYSLRACHSFNRDIFKIETI